MNVDLENLLIKNTSATSVLFTIVVKGNKLYVKFGCKINTSHFNPVRLKLIT